MPAARKQAGFATAPGWACLQAPPPQCQDMILTYHLAAAETAALLHEAVELRAAAYGPNHSDTKAARTLFAAAERRLAPRSVPQ